MAVNASAGHDRDFDVVVMGGSGKYGRFVIQEFARVSHAQQGSASTASFTYALTYRSLTKMKRTLDEITAETGYDFADVTLIEADVGNVESLDRVCRRTKVLLNCVGPYTLMGCEAVVKACIENGTDLVDLCGEALFLETVQLKYHKAAEEANVYVVESCALVSVFDEMAIQFMKEKFDGELVHVDCLYNGETAGPDGFGFDIVVWLMIVYETKYVPAIEAIRKKLFKNKLPITDYPEKKRGTLSYMDEVKKWVVPMSEIDTNVIFRTQYFNYHYRKMRPYSINYYMSNNLLQSIRFILMFLLFGFLEAFAFGRRLLEKFPAILTFGMIFSEETVKKQLKEASFSMSYVGHGYRDKLPDPDLQHSYSPDKTMVVSVTGPDGYTSTAICAVHGALCVLQERAKLPLKGGVFTPGSAFVDTSLLSTLSKNGFKYTVKRSD